MAPLRSLALLFAAATVPAQAPATPGSPAAAPPSERLLVCNKAEHSLSIFDLAAKKELAVVPTGRGPHEVAVSPDGATAVVTDYGDQMPGQTLTIVDIAAASVLRTIDLVGPEKGSDGLTRQRAFLRPHGVQFVAPDRVVVTSESTRRLLLVDLAAGAVTRTWSTPQATMHMVAVSADLRTAAATSIREGNVVAFALDGDATAAKAPIACGDGSEGLAIDPVRGHVWVGNRSANTVSVVDATAGKVVKTLPTGDFPFRIVFARGGELAVVTCAEGGQVQVFDAAKGEMLGEVSIHADVSEQSAMPMGIAVDPAGKRAFVACGRGEFVAVIDLGKMAVVDRLAARKGCDGIAFGRRE